MVRRRQRRVVVSWNEPAATGGAGQHPRPPRHLRRLLGLGLLAAISFVAGSVVRAAFVGTSGATASLSAGSVAIGDDDAGMAMGGLSGAAVGASETSCLRLTSTGTLPSTVRHLSTSQASIAPYLDVQITRGTSTSAFDSCATFTPDAADYVGAGPGVVYDGVLAGLGDDWATGAVDPSAPGVPETWTTGEEHAYRVRVTVRNDPAGGGASGSVGFSWEARSA